MSDEHLYDRLKRFEAGEAPSPYGEISIELDRGPVSQQAKRAKKDEFTQALRDQIEKYAFILTGDVQIDIEWLVHERKRYESADGPDVDNILKPLLDAISGPDGIIVDDCQVQHVACRWIDWTDENEEHLAIVIKHLDAHWRPRNDILFVEIGDNLFMPAPKSWKEDARQRLADQWKNMVELRTKLEAEGVEYGQARLVMPDVPVFHRSRLAEGFARVALDEFREGRF